MLFFYFIYTFIGTINHLRIGIAIYCNLKLFLLILLEIFLYINFFFQFLKYKNIDKFKKRKHYSKKFQLTLAADESRTMLSSAI